MECEAGKYSPPGRSICSECSFAEMSGRGQESCDSQFALSNFQADQAFFFYGFVLILLLCFIWMYCYCRRKCRKASAHHVLEATTAATELPSLRRDSNYGEKKQLDLEGAMERFGKDLKSHDDIHLDGNCHVKTLKFELQPNESILWSVRSLSEKVLVKTTWNGKTNAMSPDRAFRDILRNDHSSSGTLSIRISCRRNTTKETTVKVKYRIICESETSIGGITSALPIAVTVSSDRVSPPPPPTQRNNDEKNLVAMEEI